MTDRYVGTAVYVSFGGVDLSADYTSLTLNQEGDHEDVTAGTEATHYSVPVRTSGNMDFEFFWNGGTAQTAFDAVVANGVGTLIVGPRGTASTMPKLTIDRAIVKTRRLTMPFDKGFKLTGQWTFSAAITRGNWA